MAKVIVVGGGIAGLGAAYTLQKNGVEVSVLEAKAEPGGRMRSRQWHGAWVDLGPEYISSSEVGLLDLVSELGLDDRKLDYEGGGLAFEVWRGGRGHWVSFSRPITFLTSGALGPVGKLRLAGLIPAYIRQYRLNESIAHDAYEVWRGAWADDESLETWLSRVNPQLLEYIVEPLLEYTCSYRPYEVSKGWFLYTSTSHRMLSIRTFDEGLGLVTRTLAERLDVTTNAQVTRVVAGQTPVTVEWEKGGQSHRREVDGVLVAVPGTKVNELVVGLDKERIKFFEAVRYSPQEMIYFTLSREIEGLPIERFYPRKEEPVLSVVNYNRSSTNPDVKFLRVKMKTDHILRQWNKSEDHELDTAQEEAARYFQDAVSAIEDRLINRWREGLPLFYPGYVRAIERFLQLPPIPGVVFAGDYLAACTTGAAYRTGQRAAADLLNRLS
jgi:oxygen-dependent protoporphyrinogen oxidase